MNLYTSVFVYVCSIGLYKRIVNADTQSIRIANADGQGEVDSKILLSSKFLFYLCFELFCLQKLGKQLSLLDKREYPKGEGV